MKLFFVYGIKRNGKIFYVGFTANLTRRFAEHKRNFGPDVELVKLDEIVGSRADAEASEQRHIYDLGLVGSELFNKNVPVSENSCEECRETIIQLSGKRAKRFCDSSCRSNFWQKQDRKKVNIKDLTKNTHEASNKTKPAPKTNFTINTTKTINNGLNRPVRMEGEDAIDYAGRLNEWKKSQQ